MTITAGSPAPSFDLPIASGAAIRRLEDYLAKGPLLLAFHRGTW